MLKGKKILIGVTGSIAAYKIPFLIRLLVKEGAEVKLICTKTALEFTTPLTLSTLSGNPVYTDFFNQEDGSWHSHVELGHWADIYLIAPVTATTMSKMVNGIADNLLTATYLAAKCPVMFAPAMDVDMFNHPSTKKNTELLKSYGNIMLEPEVGELASGLTGPGRMQEPEMIVDFLRSFLRKKKELKGKKALVTAGPTYEPIDPVRFIGNYSSGKMGFAIARALAEKGAEVDLVSGPVTISTDHSNIRRTDVNTASEMLDQCLSKAGHSDIIVMTAAVSDFTPVMKSAAKIKQKKSNINLELKPTEDILKKIGGMKRAGQIVVGFALETDNELENAHSKLQNKNLDMIVLNSLNDKNSGFGYDTNKVTFILPDGTAQTHDLMSKQEVALLLADRIRDLLYQKKELA